MIYDTTPRGRVGGSAGEATEWGSDSSVLVRTPGGLGGAFDVVITVGSYLATLTGGFSMDVHLITKLAVRNRNPSSSLLLSSLEMRVPWKRYPAALIVTAC